MLLLLALLLTSARVLLQSIDRWRSDIESGLGQALGVPVHIEQLQGQWNYAYPVLIVKGLSIRTPSEGGPEGRLELKRLTLELDPLASLLNLSPVFHRFEAQSAQIRWHQRGGAWLHRPGAKPDSPSEGLALAAWEQLVTIFLQQPYAVIRDVELTLIPEQGQSLVISPADLELENARRDHRLSGLFRMPLLGETAEMKFVIETGSALQQQALDTRYRLYMELSHLGPELFRLFGREWGVEQLDLSARVWAEFDRRRLVEAQAEVELAQLGLSDSTVPYPRSARVSASLQPRGKDYQLQLEQLELMHEQARLQVPTVMLQGPASLEPAAFKAGVTELDLGALSQWLSTAPGMPAGASRLLHELQPAGTLKQLTFDKPERAGWDDWQLTADLERVQVAAWHGAPALEGVSGRLEASLKQGRIDLDSDAFGMHFPELYPDLWRYRHASGRVKWALGERGVRVSSERLTLQDEHVQAAGRFSMDLPFDRERQSELVLLIGMVDSDGMQAPIYTPAKQVGAGLHQWLQQALKAGRLRQGGLLLRTGTRRLDEPRSPVVQLFFDIGDGRLAYQPGWPEITNADLFVLVRDAGLAININRAQMLSSTIPSGWVYLPPGGRRLQVETALLGPVEDLDWVLKQTPVADLIGPSIQDWTLDRGQSQGRLSLGIPLGTGAPPEVNVAVRLDDARLRGPGDLEVSGVSGDLNYDHGIGLSAETLRGQFLGGSVEARIKPLDHRYRVQLQGQSSLPRLTRWLKLPALAVVEGKASWQGDLEICALASCPQLTIRSTLEGASLVLPGLLAKKANQLAPLKLTLRLAPEVNVVSLDLQLPADGIAPMQVSGKTGADRALHLQLQHPDLNGKVQLATTQRPLTVNLEHLQLEALMPAKGKEDGNAVEEPPAVAENLVAGVELPPTQVIVKDLWYGRKPIGEWRFRLQPEPGMLRIRDLEAYPEAMVIRGEADWVRGREGTTGVTLKMVGGDLGQLLKSWGHGQIMETEKMDALLQLQWPGAPWQFALEQLDGEFRFDTTEARLIETSDSTNILRVFGILNFNSLARRLRLDFTDLVKKGVSFDRISGHYRIENGVASTLAPLQMQGPSANMTLEGRVDLVAEELDNTVQVTLPVSSNAPLAAVLLGAPQVAGAVFVIDKLIGDKLERFSTLSYTLSGHWDDPQLELQAGSNSSASGDD